MSADLAQFARLDIGYGHVIENLRLVDIDNMATVGNYMQRAVLMFGRDLTDAGQKHMILVAHDIKRRYTLIFFSKKSQQGIDLTCHPKPLDKLLLI